MADRHLAAVFFYEDYIMAMKEQQFKVFRQNVEGLARGLLALQVEAARLNNQAKAFDITNDPQFLALTPEKQAEAAIVTSLMASYRIFIETPQDIFGLGDIWGNPDQTTWIPIGSVTPLVWMAIYNVGD